jgi:tagaturonate reductase
MDALKAYQLGETIPTMAAPPAECEAYLASVLERFANPDLFHKLEGIAAKSVSKWAARILPTAEARAAATGRAPVLAAFTLAALADRYASGSPPQDEAPALAWFASRASAFASSPEAAMAEALSAEGPWGAARGGKPIAVPGLAAEAARRLAAIRSLGMARALEAATGDSRRARSDGDSRRA